MYGDLSVKLIYDFGYVIGTTLTILKGVVFYGQPLPCLTSFNACDSDSSS
jgi:hypothetical protein